MIVDKVKIFVKAGKGGEGSGSLRRNRRGNNFGWGGDGGRGGSVFIKASSHLYDLHVFLHKRKFIAEDGRPGMANNKTGLNGKSITIEVPLGTIVRDSNQEIIHDFILPEDKIEIAKGGKPGKGNFKRQYTLPAQPGEEKEIFLDLRIPAELAIIGLPNCGKTSLFNELTGQEAKVGDYPFTTKDCLVGCIKTNRGNIRVIDLPGLKEDSHLGKGLGNDFLKHLYRVKVILLLYEDILQREKQLACLKQQLSYYNKQLLKTKKIFPLLTKIDRIKDKGFSRLINKEGISVIDKRGIDKLLLKLEQIILG